MTPDTATHDVLNVIIAARLSRKVGKYQGIGNKTQDQYSQEWASRQRDIQTIHGVYRQINVVDTVADIKSGRVAPWDRKNLRPWVTEPVKMAQYDAIIAYKNDRLSRGAFEDESRIRQWASDNGKVLIIVDGPQWPARNQGDFWAWTAMAKQAEEEWNSIQERILRMQGALRADGSLVGLAAFGLDIVGEKYDKTLASNDIGRRYVPDIFQRIADGESLRQVSAWLRAEGVTGKRGAPFGTSAVHALIKNPVYRGQRVNGAGQVELEVEPLVDARLWKRANDRLTNSQTGRRGPKQGPSAKLTGALLCVHCHSPMYRHPPRKRPSGNSFAYYRCVGTWPERKGCGNMVGLAALDKLVIDKISTSDEPHKEWRLVAGENYDVELAQVELDLDALPKRRLSRVEEDAERARLREEQDRLLDLNKHARPDEWKEVETGQTEGEYFAGLDPEQQRPYLIARYRILAGKHDDGEPYAVLDIKGHYGLRTLDVAGELPLHHIPGSRKPHIPQW
jgi:site-specific DNA recombinase